MRLMQGELVLRMDYAKLLAAEERTGCGLMALAGQLARGMLPLRTMMELVAICAGVEAGDALGQRLLECGVCTVAEALSELLCGVLSAKKDEGGGRRELQEMMARFPD